MVDRSAPSPKLTIWWWMLWGMVTSVCLLVEVLRLTEQLDQWPPLLRSLALFGNDTPMFLPWCALCPLAWWMKTGIVLHRADLIRGLTGRIIRALSPDDPSASSTAAANRTLAVDWCLACLVMCASIIVSWWFGHQQEHLPPAYHDEYSYRFQAETLLLGRLANPPITNERELFDQMHVVNLNSFSSRYFPGTGLWLAPWAAIGHPVWGQWLAGGITSLCMFWAGRHLGGSGTGLLAGFLTACSPGLVLFSNLLLAHHPTLVGLSLFLCTFLRWMRRPTNCWWLVGSGIGLSWAMICRPATAAGFALPFGVWFIIWWFRTLTSATNPDSRSIRCASLLALGVPLVAGWSVMATYNHAVTGDWKLSPYQLYTNHYTPRHIYGFNNVTKGSQIQGQRELPVSTRGYDAWAENLTWSLAVRHTGQRFLASWRWTLALIPIVWICLAAAGMWQQPHPARNLVAWSIVSLHAIHVPYWFVGIMDWHYVMESALSWILIVCCSTAYLARWFTQSDRPWLVLWLLGIIGTGLITNVVDGPPYWIGRLNAGLSEVGYSRKKYAQFERLIERDVTDRPALVLVVPDPADRHMDFVVNTPTLSASVLLGRLAAGEQTPERLRAINQAFPDRHLYVFDAITNRITPVSPSDE